MVGYVDFYLDGEEVAQMQFKDGKLSWVYCENERHKDIINTPIYVNPKMIDPKKNPKEFFEGLYWGYNGGRFGASKALYVSEV